MAIIRNKLNQRLIINLKSGKSIDLLAKGTADVSEEELSSLHLQTLASKGDIIVALENREEKTGKKDKKDLKVSPSYVNKGRN